MRTLTFVSLLTALLAGSAFAGSLDVAKKHLAEGRFPAARDAAAAIAERDAAFARAQYLVGEISLLLGENTRAVEAYRKALQAKPDSATLLTGLGRALVADDE
ncbi:MAG: tetratricopeptide repeat protein, partial [Planctomycetota bacterium]